MRRILYIALCLAATAAKAQTPAADDELTESSGLATPAAPTPAATDDPSSVRWRAYGLVDLRLRRMPPKSDEVVTDSPGIELGAAADTELSHALSPFVEGRATYRDERGRPVGIFDQGGLRWRPANRWSLALGKERSRRAPGLVVSPSDFLHSRQSLPGEREERGGIWLTRLSWQTEDQTLDVIGLPVSKTRENGLPVDDDEPLGGAIRYFQRWNGIDLGLDLGSLHDEPAAGAFVQTIARKVWKVYGEAGYDGAQEAHSHLVGLGYEGFTKYTLRAEWYENGSPLAQPPFTKGHYALLSAGAIELADRFTLNETWIRSLDDDRWVNLFRAEAAIGDRHAAGASLLHAGTAVWQATFDWKTNL